MFAHQRCIPTKQTDVDAVFEPLPDKNEDVDDVASYTKQTNQSATDN